MAYKTSSGFDTDFCGAVPFPVLRQTGGFRDGGKGISTQDLRYLDPAWNHEQVEAKHHGSPFSKAEFDQALQDMGTTYYPNRRGIDFYHTYKTGPCAARRNGHESLSHLYLLGPAVPQRR